ncbi:MAG: NAD+ synthase [Syntrophomonas sp.]
MKVTIAQLNPIVGDLKYNLNKLAEILPEAQKAGSDLVILPELYLVGYPPRDLLEKPWFIEQVSHAVDELKMLSTQYPEIGILIGAPLPNEHKQGRALRNSALLIYQGKVIFQQDKSLLPVYDVFDETRYFEPAQEIDIVLFKGYQLAISICEDAWNDPDFWPAGKMYSLDPIEVLGRKRPDIFINISASPFCVGKEKTRFKLISNHARRHKVPFIYINQVGGNDELIFDGRSMFIDARGEEVLVGSAFKECVTTVDVESAGNQVSFEAQEEIESIYQALVLGIHDYLHKCGFSKAVIGLSGGIDSAVTCCLAVEALGPKNVLGISMPSPYSSSGSIEDSKQLAGNLGIPLEVIPVSDIYESYLQTTEKYFDRTNIGLTQENIQARIRGNILMAFSNRYDNLVLTTGNKSEMAVGYCTLYGDMSGGLSVLSDVPKTMVYDLARFINRKKEIIPVIIIEKAPSAELKPDQRDQDTLPPYDILDQILNLYIEHDFSTAQIIDRGFDPVIVQWVVKAVNRNEYKRRQAAPGLKVTSKAFGVGRRMPVAARYNG